MEERNVVLDEGSYWGEISEAEPSENLNFHELFELKTTECEQPKFHQITSKHASSKESVNQNLASIQPPVDAHGQNLLLHSIELKHHIRKMMLMKMAAQHQQAGGNKNDNLPQLPCAPPPPKKYCSKNGIYVRPQQRGFLSKPVQINIKSPFVTDHGVGPVELNSDSLRCLTYKAVAAICCHSGYETSANTSGHLVKKPFPADNLVKYKMKHTPNIIILCTQDLSKHQDKGAHELTLDVLSDVLADFFKRFSKLMRIAADAEASQRESRFPSVLEYALQETGIGGLNSIWQYWSTNVLEYALKLQQEDQRLIADYEKLT